MTLLLRLLGLSLPALAVWVAAANPAKESTLRAAALLDAGQPVRIVCFGDSITGVYYHTGNRRAWCDLLGVALQRIYPRAALEMINAGVSGNNTNQALARMDRDVLSRAPQLVVVMFGMNDIVAVAPEVFHQNMVEIVRRARARDAEVILLTPNPIYPDDPIRPPARLAEYVEIIRRLGAELNVPIVDTCQVFEAIAAVDRPAWERLMSDSIHPNLLGHAVFAEEVAFRISGRRVSLANTPRPQPELPHVRARLEQHLPLNVVAMKPYDTLIGPALLRIYPGATVNVTAWTPDPVSLPAIDAQAKDLGWWKYRNHHELTPPDLTVVAVPATAVPASGQPFSRAYRSILHWSSAFSPGAWDTLAALPSFAQPALSPPECAAETCARDAILGADLPSLERPPGDATPTLDLLTLRLRAMLAPAH